jgi:hypothetical protein
MHDGKRCVALGPPGVEYHAYLCVITSTPSHSGGGGFFL